MAIIDPIKLARELRANLDDLGEFLTVELANELSMQGHKATGSLIRSIDFNVTAFANALALEIEYLEYGRYVETGVSASRIPFGRKTGAKTSKYIQALIEWIKVKRIASGMRAVGLAFGIAKKHKQEGMPTRGSYQFSSNGRRIGFQSYVINQNISRIDSIIQDGLEAAVSAQLDNLIANITR
jgi:hypothetical protein